MSTLFGIFGVIFLLLGIGSCGMAKAAPGEIEGLILVLTGMVLFVGAAIVQAIEKHTKAQERLINPTGTPTVKSHFQCTDCKGLIAVDAVVCMHCGKRYDQPSV